VPLRPKRISVLLVTGFLWQLFLFTHAVDAQDKSYYFYKSQQTRGSDAQFSPLSLLLNGSFDALRLSPDAGRSLTSLKWKNDFENVWDNLSHPVGSIRAYGWDVFRRQELFNASFSTDDLQFIPNVADHVIGYGMLYAKITEWYDAHGYKSPVLWGVGTSLVYQYVNEMVQNGGVKYVNVDCIADVYIYNTLGFALFSFRDVKGFFSETMHLNDWSLQPLFVLRNHHSENAGQEFVMKYALSFAKRYAPFICWGVNSIAGLSYRYDAHSSVSLGWGKSITGMTEKKRGEYLSATPNFERAAGLFWDTDGSLLTSLIVSGKPPFNVQLNVYPGLVEFHGIKPGCYLGIGKREGLVFGVTFLGLPISVGFER
jgi:hypothetical protein